jgi:hypothetical protein
MSGSDEMRGTSQVAPKRYAEWEVDFACVYGMAMGAFIWGDIRWTEILLWSAFGLIFTWTMRVARRWLRRKVLRAQPAPLSDSPEVP